MKNDYIQMSSNKFRAIRPKLEELTRKEHTPKSKYSPKVSPIYASIRNGLIYKQDTSNSKIKPIRPMTSKNTQDKPQYFHSRETQNDKKLFHNSSKKIEVPRQSHRLQNTSNNVFEYQVRAKSKSPLRQPDEIVREEIIIQIKKYEPQSRDIKSYENNHPPLPEILHSISNFEAAKHSLKSNGIIKAYSASTNQGPVRDYNEDRVAIILNITRPEGCTDWKKAAYFGVFDGHGGMDCADFLRDNLHNCISKQKSFPNQMIEAITSGFEKCQNTFLEYSYNGKFDKSGSCAIITFFYGNECYISNVGDSRAIMSSMQGKKITELSIDHKASDEFQQHRITENNGKIYQTKLRNANPNSTIFYQGEEHPFIMGPHRVFPGRLSVTRTFGDIAAKMPEFGGYPKVIVCTPQIRRITITPNDDFLILASDGIFDKMVNADVIEIVWDTFRRDQGKFKTLHEFCGRAVQNIMKLSFFKKTSDNITVVMVALEGLEAYFQRGEYTLNRQSAQIDQNNRKSGKMETSFERKHMGRSTSPSNYGSIRTRSFYRN